MLSIVIIILIIQQISPTYQLKTIQATLASTVELPCSVVNQNNESTNPAQVNVQKGQVFIYLIRAVQRRKEKNSFQGVDNNNDIISYKQLANI
jgi:hypothetical protein